MQRPIRHWSAIVGQGLLGSLLAGLIPLLGLAHAGPNLHPHPDLPHTQGWMLAGASGSPVSRGTGGSIQLRQGDRAIGPAMRITPGATYTCGLAFLGTHRPTDFVRLSLAFTDAHGAFLANSPSASTWGYPQPDVWQEAFILHQVRPREAHMRLLLSRDVAVSGTTPVFIDDVWCVEGLALPPAPAKRPFQGTLVQVDATGQVAIRQPDGTFRPEFLRCMFTLGSEPWAHYVANGWNCNMWATSLASVARGVQAGLPYAFYQLGHFIHPGTWAEGDLGRLRKELGEILASPYAANLIGYYYDNESPAQFVLASQVLALVAELDTQAGQRQRPIYILQGNPGYQMAYTAYADMTGTYHVGGGLQTHLLTLQHSPGQTTPVVFGQIQEGWRKTTAQFVRQIREVRAAGATAIGYWHTRPIAREAWYPDFPALVAAELQPAAASPVPRPLRGLEHR